MIKFSKEKVLLLHPRFTLCGVGLFFMDCNIFPVKANNTRSRGKYA